MMQYFHWYTDNDGNFWTNAGENAQKLAELGINAVWLPPADKGKKVQIATDMMFMIFMI